HRPVGGRRPRGDQCEGRGDGDRRAGDVDYHARHRAGADDPTMTTVRVQPTTDTPGHPRERMIQSALLLMGERGIEATSFSQVIEHSGAPRGSIYHHFPGGKAQLVEEATRYAGDAVVNLLDDAVTQADDPAAAVDAIVAFWRGLLYNSDF